MKNIIIMKNITYMLGILAVLLVLASGCSCPERKENMLSAAGFKMMPANTPQREEHLKSLPDDRLTTANLNGHNYFVFPDWAESALFVGQEPQYQHYQKMRLENQMGEERVHAAEITDDWAGWGSWGRW
jgi:hypothetical protein